MLEASGHEHRTSHRHVRRALILAMHRRCLTASVYLVATLVFSFALSFASDFGPGAILLSLPILYTDASQYMKSGADDNELIKRLYLSFFFIILFPCH